MFFARALSISPPLLAPSSWGRGARLVSPDFSSSIPVLAGSLSGLDADSPLLRSKLRQPPTLASTLIEIPPFRPLQSPLLFTLLSIVNYYDSCSIIIQYVKLPVVRSSPPPRASSPDVPGRTRFGGGFSPSRPSLSAMSTFRFSSF